MLLSRFIANFSCTGWRLQRPGVLALCMLVLAGVAPASAEHFKIGGTGSALATMRLLADAYSAEYPGTTITILPSLGSGGGIKAVLSGAIQVAVSARPLKDKETQAGASAVELSRTPFVFASQTQNPVSGLTEQELADILSGKTQEWPDGTRIRLVLRPVGDSDSNMVKSISPAIREAKTAAEQRKGMPFAVTDQDAADAIEKITGALGTSTLAQILSEKRRIKPLSWKGVQPSADSLADGRYPFQKTYLVVTGEKTPAAARDFVAFLQSPKAREILMEYGHLVRP